MLLRRMTIKLSRRITDVEESKTLAVTEKAARLKAEGVDIISLGAGEPDFDTPDFVKEAAVEALRKGMTKYTPATGTKDLKLAIVNKFKRDNRLEYSPEDVVVSCGAKHSIYNILQVLIEEGDEVLIPSPYWTSYPDMVKLARGTPKIIRTEARTEFRVTPDQLEKAIGPKTKAIILCSPSNPTGAVYTREQLKALAAVLEKSEVVIISDEIYEKFYYEGGGHTSIAEFSPKLKSQTVVVNGLSKAYSMTGWRIGYAAGPREIMKACAKLQSQVTSNPTSIAQYAAAAAINSDGSFCVKMVAEFKKRRDLVHARLNRIAGIQCLLPGGAFYLFPDCSGLYGKTFNGRVVDNSGTLAEMLIDSAKVALVPGDAFGEDRCQRISYSYSIDLLNRAVDRIESFASQLK